MSSTFQEMTQDIQDRIRDMAYIMWESAGRQQGMAMEYWLAAEREVIATMQRAAEHIVPGQGSSQVHAEPQPAAPELKAAAVESGSQSERIEPAAPPAMPTLVSRNPEPLQQQKARSAAAGATPVEKPARKPASRATKSKA